MFKKKILNRKFKLVLDIQILPACLENSKTDYDQSLTFFKIFPCFFKTDNFVGSLVISTSAVFEFSEKYKENGKNL